MWNFPHFFLTGSLITCIVGRDKVSAKFPNIPLSSLSLLGRVPPIHLLVSALLFLPGQALTRSLQLNYFCSLDPGASGSVHLYSSVFGVTAAVILFRNVKVENGYEYKDKEVILFNFFEL